MSSALDIFVEHDELYSTFHVNEKKILLMINLLKMYILFSCQIYDQNLIKKPGVLTIPIKE